MVSSQFIVLYGDTADESKYVTSISDPCLFLRDDLSRATGERIWGLTFTLHRDGKFNIEDDYNKPGYEETDEVNSGDEINASSTQLMGRDKNFN